MTPKTILLLFHVLGVVCGVGGVLMLDIDLVRLLRGTRITAQNVALTHFVSAFVKAGLVAVWVSGVLIIAIAPDGPASVLANPKLQAKLVVVVVLTINALFIETLALPLLVRNVGRPLFDGVDQVRRSVVLGCGAVSTLSWLFPIALGLARELNGVVPAQIILTDYILLLAGLAVTMQVAGRIFYRPALDAAGGWPATSPTTASSSGVNRMFAAAIADERVVEVDASTSDRLERSARQAGRDAIRTSVSPDQVSRDVASLGSDGERWHYRAGLFEALAARGGPDPDAGSLLEFVAADEALRRKFAAVAPDSAARGAFSSTVEQARRRAEDRMWAKVRDWHASMVTLNAGETVAGTDGATRPSAVAG